MEELKIDAEEAVVSALLVDQKCIEKIYGILSPEMFENAIYGRVYLEYCRAFDRSKEISLVELQEALIADGYKDYEVEYSLRNALTGLTTSAEVAGSAKVVADKYKTSCAETILSRTQLAAGKIDEQIDSLITDLEKLRSGDSSQGRTVAEIAKSFKDDYFCDREKNLILLKDEQIDGMTGGFQGGDLCVLGARPSCGKSALATQWAEQLASQGYRVGYYNLEMQDRALYERFIASKSGIETTRVRLAKMFLNDEEKRYQKAVEELSKQENIVIFTGARKMSDIRRDMREYKFSVVILDYLQLVTPNSRYQGNRTAEVGEISRDCKNIAMDFDCVVLALTQLNRASEGRADKRPTMADIRESGSIEQDASIICLMWQADEDDRSKKSFEVVKSRNGRTGRADFIFDGAHLRFSHEQAATPFD